MNIITDKPDNYKEIFVMGELQSKEDVDYLFTLLNKKDLSEITVTFFEARVISAYCIEKLTSLLENKTIKKLNISVLYAYLHTYLLRLGLKNRLLPRKILYNDMIPKITTLAIGGSAGSLDKIIEIVKKLPLAEITLFIIQHIKEDSHSYLPALLAEKAKCKAVVPSDNEKVEKGIVYIAPPGYHMKVMGGLICLSMDQLVNYARPSIEVTFKSLSAEYQEKFCAVIVSGYGSDGIKSLPYLKEKGSKIIIEDPDECEAKDLPQNALNTGFFDRKLPISGIVSYLQENISYVLPMEEDIILFLQKVYDKYGYDYRNYEMQSIKRRINVTMIKASIKDFRFFEIKVLDNSSLFEELFLELSINVTEFFRDSDTYKVLREKVLPCLNSYSHIKIWSCGCSTGEEPYSLAILLDELGMLRKSLIYATDINPFVLEEAKNGLFSHQKIQTSLWNYINSGGLSDLNRYFEAKKNYVKIDEKFRDNILFFQHSLIDSGVLNEFQLILCRNVMIYFNDKIKDNVLKLFSNSLDKSGFLVLGKSEEILSAEGKHYFKGYDNKNKIYTVL